jgi:hypothetical protein
LPEAAVVVLILMPAVQEAVQVAPLERVIVAMVVTREEEHSPPAALLLIRVIQVWLFMVLHVMGQTELLLLVYIKAVAGVLAVWAAQQARVQLQVGAVQAAGTVVAEEAIPAAEEAVVITAVQADLV